MNKRIGLWVLPIAILLFFSCTNNATHKFYLVHGHTAKTVELNTIQDLKKDLSKVSDFHIELISETEPLPTDGTIFLLGTPNSNTIISELANQSKLNLSTTNPGPRGGVWNHVTLENNKKAIVLAGSDVQGFQYAVYDYAKEILGIDPLEYWTEKLPDTTITVDVFAFKNKTIAPPKVPTLCYFENDVDELANYRGKLLEYDWESYTEMINSLVRLRYNAIQLFDMLGRPEFFLRPEYKKLSPDYKIDINYIEKMIDYAQSKGMKVAIDFALGYQIHPMSTDKATCWKDYKEDWLTAWRYYLEETPLEKTDIFILRPRHQVWDWEYKSSCEEDKIEVFNQVYEAFGKLVDEYKPNADKVLVCYSDGMQMWNDGFRPPKDWIVLWSDHGFGDFEYLPNTTENYNFGTYMHAGFWLNHTVHNPYPKKVETIMKDMFTTYSADKFCLVNGQNFRPFIFNIEAYAEVANNPETFLASTFFTTWTERYFSEMNAKHAIASMKLLSKAQKGRIGYVQHLWEIREAISYLSDTPIERPGKTPTPSEYRRVENDYEHVAYTSKFIHKALAEAKKGLVMTKTSQNFYYDYIYLPTLLYADLIIFERSLHQMAMLKKQTEDTGNTIFLKEAFQMLPQVKAQLKTVYTNRMNGDKNPKWANWYNPAIRRPNNGFPDFKMLEAVEKNINNQLN
ncbi:glycosyl hydrolase 115 family protein [Aurantibacter sp.]|uniref:glycosyl hydrolase 115 family protein n=1 Tax=Aurantibacter sp. TaxID=2807103 RepID=UPI003264BE4C